MGIAAANLLGNALGGEGEIGFIFHDAPFYVTNQRDQAFKSWIEINFPGIQIVAEQGLADPAAAEDIASTMLTRNPGLDGIYAPWSAGPADGVLAALRAAGASDVAVVTMDLDTNVSLDLVEGGNMVGIAADEAYEIGRTMATEGAYGLLGKEARRLWLSRLSKSPPTTSWRHTGCLWLPTRPKRFLTLSAANSEQVTWASL